MNLITHYPDAERALDAQARLGAMEMEAYSLERGQTLEKTGRVLDNIDRAEKDALSKSARKNNLLNLSVMTYAILAVGAVILLFGLIMGIILLAKKKTVAGLAVLAVAVSAGIMAGAYGYDALQKTGPTDDDLPSIPGLGKFDEELILEEENGTGIENSPDAGAVDGSERPDTGEDAGAPLSDPGRIYNKEFGYSLEIGEEFVERMTQLPTDEPFYEGSVMYCYDLDDDTYEDWSCGKGMVNVFMIAILNDEQYEEEKESPFYDPDYDMGVHNGLHYVFSHPNGDFPEEVLPLIRAYGDIAGSIEFAETEEAVI